MSSSWSGTVRRTVWICRTVVTDSTVRGHSARRDHRGKGREGEGRGEDAGGEKLLKTDQMTNNHPVWRPPSIYLINLLRALGWLWCVGFSYLFLRAYLRWVGWLYIEVFKINSWFHSFGIFHNKMQHWNEQRQIFLSPAPAEQGPESSGGGSGDFWPALPSNGPPPNQGPNYGARTQLSLVETLGTGRVTWICLGLLLPPKNTLHILVKYESSGNMVPS